MQRYIAFLRAINVGGRVVKMEKLRELFESLGFTNVETFIASGNVIFETRSRSASGLQKRIEECLLDALGYEVATFIRTDSELAAIAEHKAFPESRVESAGALNIGFLAEPLTGEQKSRLMEFQSEIDDFHLHDREIYWLCAKKQSESDFSNAVMEKALGTRATFRGINTVRKLAARYSP